MKTYFSFLFLILYFNLYSQSGLVSGNYSVVTNPINNGNGTFNVSGTFSDPKGQYFASEVDSGMVFWKGNHFYLIDSILNVSGSTLDIRVQDTYSTGFIPTGVAQIVELTPNLSLPGVSTTGDSNPALATPPDYAALLNYLIQRIDNVFGGSGLDLDSLIDIRLVGENLELELVSGQVLSQSLSSLDFTAWRTLGGVKQNDETGFAHRTGNTTIGVLDSNTHKFRVDGTFQFNPEPGFVFDFQGTGPVPHKSLVLTSDLDNLSGSWPPPNGANYSFLKNSISTDRDLLGSISFLGLDDLGNLYNGGGIDVFADGNWTSSGKGTSVNIWTTSPTETFARNVATFKGDGRLELDRYSTFDDGNPYAIAGFSNDGNDLTRHPINGAIPTDTAMILFDPINDHYFWSDLATSIGTSSLWSENDTVVFYNGLKDIGIGNNTATEKLDVTGNIKLSGNVIIDGLNQKFTSNYIARIKDIIFADNETVPSINIGTTGGRWMSVQSGDEDGGIIFRTAQRFNPNELEDVLALRRGTAGIGTIAYDNPSDARFSVKAGGYLTNYIARFLDTSDNVEFEISNSGNVQIGTSFDFASGARFTLPSFTTLARDALTANTGEFIFNSDESKPQFYDGSVWKNFIIPGTNRTISVDASHLASDLIAMVTMDDTTNDADYTVYTLNPSPNDGDSIKFVCVSSNIDGDDGCRLTSTVNINGAASDFTFSSQYQAIELIYSASQTSYIIFQ